MANLIVNAVVGASLTAIAASIQTGAVDFAIVPAIPEMTVVYVDSVGGDDANDGLSQATALQTLSAAQTAALAVGDNVTVAFVAGSEWEEELLLNSLDGVRVEGVGDLANDGFPKIRGDSEITGTWDDSTARADGLSNTYSISWTHTIQASQQIGGPSVWAADGTLLEWQASAADVDANPGSYYHDGATSDTSPVTLYVNNGEDPSGLGYRATKRNRCIYLGDNATVRYVWGMRQGHDDGSIRAGSNANINRCILEDGVFHCALFTDGVFRECVASRQAGGRAGGFMLESYAVDATDLEVTWDTCVAIGPGVEASPSASAFGGHSSSGNFYKKWTITDCAVKNTSISGDDVGAVETNRLRLVNSTWNVATELAVAPSQTHVDMWVDWTHVPAGAQNLINLRDTGTGVSFDGLRIYAGSDFTTTIRALSGSIASLDIQNSVLVDAGGAATRNFISCKDTVNVEGTVFDANAAPANNNFIELADNSWSADGNVFHPDSVKLKHTRGDPATSYTTTTAYLTAVQPGQEANSVIADPQIADAANGDFTLGGTGLPSGVGLARDVTCQQYTPIPADLAAAEAWILSL